MIAYNKTLLDNTLLADEASSLKNSGFITSAQYKTILVELPTLKSHKNGLIRLGFFLLGSFLYSSICGMFSFFLANSNNLNYEILLFVYSIIGFAGMEFFAREKQYGFGLDDAFLLGAQMLLFVGIGITSNENYLLVCVAIALVSTLSYLRYVHLLSVALACIGFAGSLAYLMFEFGTIGKSILPFVMMLFSAMGYLLSKKGLKKLKSPYYSKGIQLANSFCLVLFYVSGNYLIVRELSIILLEKDIPATQEIPFALFFYAFTISIPACYLLYSLLKKDKPMLWIGFLALAFSIFTIRYYHHLLPVEVALTFGGLLLFVFTYFSIKKIKNNKTGITFLPDRFSNSNSQLNLETVIVASQFGLKPEIKPEESPMDFGGGGFSGGGSSGEF
jgi:hypothetical protein